MKTVLYHIKIIRTKLYLKLDGFVEIFAIILSSDLFILGFMQVKPASDCKIFVANLPLDVKVETVNSMFAKFGAVDEVHLIRDHRGDFKGCAFVRYRSKSDAVTAIQRLNESKNLKGATGNLIVRFADFIDNADVGVIQSRRGFCFGQKALSTSRVAS